MEGLVTEKRRELIEVVSEVDDKLAEAFLNDEPITSSDLKVILAASHLTCFAVCFWQFHSHCASCY